MNGFIQASERMLDLFDRPDVTGYVQELEGVTTSIHNKAFIIKGEFPKKTLNRGTMLELHKSEANAYRKNFHNNDLKVLRFAREHGDSNLEKIFSSYRVEDWAKGFMCLGLIAHTTTVILNDKHYQFNYDDVVCDNESFRLFCQGLSEVL